MNMLIQNSSLYPLMIKYIFFLVCLPSFVFAETWQCEPFFNENSRGNVNEQKIYTKVNGHYIKSSQFGDIKLQVANENNKMIVINSKASNTTLEVYLSKEDKSFIETYIDTDTGGQYLVKGSCQFIE